MSVSTWYDRTYREHSFLEKVGNPMSASKRREAIISILENETNPVAARQLADEFQVSRQIIVGDIALLRAEGNEILSTPRGYLYGDKDVILNGFTAKLVCQHSESQTRQELDIIVRHGGEVLDVQVEHPLYGLLSGVLRIKTIHDVDAFIVDMVNNKSKMLSSLTDGIHIHTVKCKDKQTFDQIQDALKKVGILYQ